MTTVARKAGWTFAAIVLAAIAAVVGVRGIVGYFRPPAADWKIVADDQGQIGHVACVVNSARRSVLRNAALVTEIVNALPPHVRVTILTNDPTAFTVARDPNPGRVDFLELPGEGDFTIWPQDPFLVLTGPQGRQCLLASAEFDRGDDRLIAERLAPRLGFEYRTSRLAFQGGNVVVGGRHVFIGAETIRHNGLRLDISDEEVVRRFQRELGRPVIVLGPLPQPIGHIDMALSPLDEHRLALADPAWGARLAEEELAEYPDRVETFERMCEEQYFGDPEIQVIQTREGEEIRPQRIVGQTPKAIEASRVIAPHLDELARSLEKFGYRVERIPYLFLPEPEEDERSREDAPPDEKSEEPQPGYPCLTYNNVLMETFPEERIVYLPQYGWPTIDSVARQAWEDLGYRVVGVEGLEISAISGGSLRCCTKVLIRKETGSNRPVNENVPSGDR